MTSAKMNDGWTKVIGHVDMDAFFAAVEILKNPELRGKPVIIGADPGTGSSRGVVSTASYEARKFGVHSAMPISRAYRLCPQGIYIRPRGSVYKEYSLQIIEILKSFTPQIQVVSIDEAFLDLTGSIHLHGGIHEIGTAIKTAIFQQTGLTASVGIAASKSVAKIASDFQKPDGLTIVSPDSQQNFLDPLTINKIWGVGKKSAEALEKMGVNTVAQLRAYPLDFLEERFGKSGLHLYKMARGIDNRDVHEGDPIKSVSHERTFGTDQDDNEILISTMLKLAEKVAFRLRKYGFRGRTIQLKIRLEDFSTFSRSKTIADPVHLTEDIYSVCLGLFQQFERKNKAVRLIGVGVTQLVSEEGLQTTIWEEENKRKETLEKVMDNLQNKFGQSALTHADTLTATNRKKDRKK